tara:strand:- start:468 stop:2621 length:2154 start_codon:yes stop_codon:yes gene_type:complete
MARAKVEKLRSIEAIDTTAPTPVEINARPVADRTAGYGTQQLANALGILKTGEINKLKEKEREFKAQEEAHQRLIGMNYANDVRMRMERDLAERGGYDSFEDEEKFNEWRSGYVVDNKETTGVLQNLNTNGLVGFNKITNDSMLQFKEGYNQHLIEKNRQSKINNLTTIGLNSLEGQEVGSWLSGIENTSEILGLSKDDYYNEVLPKMVDNIANNADVDETALSTVKQILGKEVTYQGVKTKISEHPVLGPAFEKSLSTARENDITRLTNTSFKAKAVLKNLTGTNEFIGEFEAFEQMYPGVLSTTEKTTLWASHLKDAKDNVKLQEGLALYEAGSQHMIDETVRGKVFAKKLDQIEQSVANGTLDPSLEMDRKLDVANRMNETLPEITNAIASITTLTSQNVEEMIDQPDVSDGLDYIERMRDDSKSLERHTKNMDGNAKTLIDLYSLGRDYGKLDRRQALVQAISTLENSDLDVTKFAGSGKAKEIRKALSSIERDDGDSYPLGMAKEINKRADYYGMLGYPSDIAVSKARDEVDKSWTTVNGVAMKSPVFENIPEVEIISNELAKKYVEKHGKAFGYDEPEDLVLVPSENGRTWYLRAKLGGDFGEIVQRSDGSLATYTAEDIKQIQGSRSMSHHNLARNKADLRRVSRQIKEIENANRKSIQSYALGGIFQYDRPAIDIEDAKDQERYVRLTNELEELKKIIDQEERRLDPSI